jgi:hypothetical protein
MNEIENNTLEMEILNGMSSHALQPRRQERRQAAPRARYVPTSVVAMKLEPGQSLWVANTKTPDNRFLALGRDFDWKMPSLERGGVTPFPQARDASAAALFTALVPLLVALHNPWDVVGGGSEFTGAMALGHIRAARQTRAGFDIVEAMDPSRFCPDVGLWKGCSETGKLEHLILGGPKKAVIYEDELIIPAFHYEEGVRTDFLFSFIVDEQEAALLGRQFAHGARMRSAVAAGAPVKLDAVACGEIRTQDLGKVRLKFDAAGRLFDLVNDGRPTMLVKFPNGVTVRRGAVIEDGLLRALLQLPPLEGATAVILPSASPTTGAALTAVPAEPATLNEPAAMRERRAYVVPVEAAKPKAVPTVERRTKAPTLAELTVIEEARAAEVVLVKASELEDEERAAPLAAPVIITAPRPMMAVDPLTPDDYAGPVPPAWFAEACKELLPLIKGKPAPAAISAGDGTVIAAVGDVMNEDTAMALIMYYDQLVFEGEDLELLYKVKEITTAYAEVYGE